MDITSYLLGKKVSGGSSGGHDWSAIGYASEPQTITDDYNYAKQLYDNWDNTQTSLRYKYINDTKLVYMPLVDTSNITSVDNAFTGCSRLQYVPILNFSKVSVMSNIFNSCNGLSNEAIDNILQICIGATSYTGTKTLKYLGFTSSRYSASAIQALPHYQSFIDAGWTIGY